MKTLIRYLTVAIFGIEICSPFFLGYLNQKEKTRKVYTESQPQNIELSDAIAATKTAINWETIDFTDNNYSDSKTFTVQE